MPSEINAHEEGFARFLAEPGRRRILSLLSLGSKRRKDVRDLLDHDLRLDPRYSQIVTGYEHRPKEVIKKLKFFGAPNLCWIMSSNADLDGHEAPLDEAIISIFDSMSGGFASCQAGKLGFYQYEAPGPGFLLIRR